MGGNLQLGSKVRLQKDNGWGSPGCVLSRVGMKLRVYWPDENIFTDELPSGLVPYMDCATQPQEVAA